MAARSLRNPFYSFTTLPVTLLASAVYLSLFAGLLYVHLVVPSAPVNPTPVKGVNLTEAWLDLQELSNGFRPYNSHRNDLVRHWLLQRISSILEGNEISPSIERLQHVDFRDDAVSSHAVKPALVTVYDDLVSNKSFSRPEDALSVYFEGTNIIVYIRGKNDDAEDWWRHAPHSVSSSPRGVLVNAHYDSVSTGFGATDDGVGVVSVLQLIKYFSTPGNQPDRGLVALLNNGEEDYLNGAQVFMQHPISRFPASFLNLEGAGAGGRAMLFRSTDTEITQAYKKSKYPFGSVISADGFQQGLIRSQTDYVVFNGQLGLRGLDVAFMEPRAKYHTSQDSARYTSKNSLWHMLSAALTTTRTLTRSEFDADQSNPTNGVWFDLFGRAFALFSLNALFAITVTFLLLTPIILIAVLVTLKRVDKYYLFATKQRSPNIEASDDEQWIRFFGWRGVFRFPVAFMLASGVVVALAFLVTKVNPYIVYSSQYAVWSMMLSAWIFVAWFVLRGSDSIRPSALHRTYVFMWLFLGGWIILVSTAVVESRYKIASVYFIVIPFASVFLGLLISLVELLALPKQADYVSLISQSSDPDRSSSEERVSASNGSAPRIGRNPVGDSSSRQGSRENEDTEPTETTSLLSSDRNITFSGYRRRIGRHDGSDDDEPQSEPNFQRPIGDEQLWSGSMPSWTWIVQFLLFAPMLIILVGQIALSLTSGLHQTPADGNSVLLIYSCIAILSIILLVPLSPFLHRFSYHIPMFLFLIFIGTLIYNLVAFPFSDQSPLKVFFVQKVDLDTGVNMVSLTGLEGYTQQIIASLPSSAGEPVNITSPYLANRKGLITVSWKGLPPQVTSLSSAVQKRSSHAHQYESWLRLNITKASKNSTSATFELAGLNTRACRMYFSPALANFTIEGESPQDGRSEKVSAKGVEQLRLWHRKWDRSWIIHVSWNSTNHDKYPKLEGRAVCLWSDQNQLGIIPALDEVRAFMPSWSTLTKLDDGLVEGSKAFRI